MPSWSCEPRATSLVQDNGCASVSFLSLPGLSLLQIPWQPWIPAWGGTAELPWGCWLGWLHLSSGETLAPLLCITDSVLPSASLARMALSGGRALPATLPVLCSLNAGSENSPGSRPGEKSPSQNTELQLSGLLSEHKIGAKKDRCVFVCFVFCLLSF